MKNIKYILIILLMLIYSSCDEDKLLEEVPKAFTVVENSYVEPGNFDAAIAQLYNQARRYFGNANGSPADMDMWFGTDCGWHARDFDTHTYSVYSSFGPDNVDVAERWREAYKIVSNANTIIDRIVDVAYDNEAQKTTTIAEARFFRAWAYRTLAYIYGDVPLILTESLAPRRDFTRTARAEVLDAIIEDLQFAKNNLPTVNEINQEGRLHKDVASHFLAELYIVTGNNQGAISEASEIIDGGNYALMTSRFGTRMDEPQGNVWWDLFRRGNQNRSTGNTEGIWIYQVEFETIGGYGRNRGSDANFWERQLGPEYNRWKSKDETPGQNTFMYESTYHGGRGQGFFRPSSHMTHNIWRNVDPTDWDNDIRNSESNIMRQWWVDNPLSIYYNDTIDLKANSAEAYQKYLSPATIENDSNRYLYPIFLKYVSRNNHVELDLLSGDGNNPNAEQAAQITQEHLDLIASYGGIGPKMVGNARRYYADHYAVRLPETLLLRAEAYMNMGMTMEAADDINVIRQRANAALVNADDVDIDLILDERLRELFLEEPRRLTLNRLGLLYDRTRRFNFYSSSTVQEHHNLYPIPSSEIQNNSLGDLNQNPGY